MLLDIELIRQSQHFIYIGTFCCPSWLRCLFTKYPTENQFLFVLDTMGLWSDY